MLQTSTPFLPCSENPVQTKAIPAAPGYRPFGTDITNLPPTAMEVDPQPPKLQHLYTREIFDVLLANETQSSACFGYMKKQPDINERMRGILVDWLIEVHLKFRLHTDTLFLTVNIVDRVLEKTVVYRQQLQLVGVAAMFISAKYEEIYPPELKDLVYITDSAFLREDILDMEAKILLLLEYRITAASPHRFLERFEEVTGSKDATIHLAHYLLELALLDYKMLRYKASVAAAAALFLSRKIHDNVEAWSIGLFERTNLSEVELRACAKDLVILAQNAEKSSLQAVRKKFALSKFSEVSTVTNFRLLH